MSRGQDWDLDPGGQIPQPLSQTTGHFIICGPKFTKTGKKQLLGNGLGFAGESPY